MGSPNFSNNLDNTLSEPFTPYAGSYWQEMNLDENFIPQTEFFDEIYEDLKNKIEKTFPLLTVEREDGYYYGSRFYLAPIEGFSKEALRTSAEVGGIYGEEFDCNETDARYLVSTTGSVLGEIDDIFSGEWTQDEFIKLWNEEIDREIKYATAFMTVKAYSCKWGAVYGGYCGGYVDNPVSGSEYLSAAESLRELFREKPYTKKFLGIFNYTS